MKRLLLLFATTLLLGIQSHAQTGVAINPTGAEADSCAMLDVSSTTKGLLVPRMTLVQRTAIVNPAKGLLVYQNDGAEGFYYYDGSVWTNLSLVNFTESNYTYDSRTGVKLTPNNPENTVDLVLSPKGTGSIIAQQPDGNWFGGENRGGNSVDLQLSRNWSSHVASGSYSVITGGFSNCASGLYSVVSGGAINTASGKYSFVGGGYYNTAQSYGESVLGLYATIGSGDATSFVSTDRLFVIGNGSYFSRSNALTILKNGNTTIGGSLTINSNGTNTSLTFPNGRGTSGQFLKTSGDGTTSWANAVEPGTAPGQMQYWNGTSWITVTAGQNGQILRFVNGVPTWTNDDLINSLNIGDFYQGGKIAYFLQPGDPGYDANVRHGLIAAPTDQSTGALWGCYGTEISGADGIALGTGAQNTLDIVNGCSAAGIAARICNDLELNGYSDWYLPSKDELNKLYLNKATIGDFASAFYFSSSEYSSHLAWLQSFNNGSQGGSSKGSAYYVRAVRAF